VGAAPKKKQFRRMGESPVSTLIFCQSNWVTPEGKIHGGLQREGVGKMKAMRGTEMSSTRLNPIIVIQRVSWRKGNIREPKERKKGSATMTRGFKRSQGARKREGDKKSGKCKTGSAHSKGNRHPTS